MKRCAFVLSAAICLAAVPAFAGSLIAAYKPIILAQVDVHVGEGGVRIGDEHRERRDHDRDRRRRDAERDHDRDCRTVTVREHEGDRVVVRKTRRCD